MLTQIAGEVYTIERHFEVVLPRQLDEYIGFDTTRAVRPLETARLRDVPQTYPFGQ